MTERESAPKGKRSVDRQDMEEWSRPAGSRGRPLHVSTGIVGRRLPFPNRRRSQPSRSAEVEVKMGRALLFSRPHPMLMVISADKALS